VHQQQEAHEFNGQRGAVSALFLIVGPAEYRSACAASPVRRQLSLAPRGIALHGCQKEAVVHNAA
jgi:hypothetical protein